MPLTINVTKNENATIIRMAGQVDEITAAQLRNECTSWILQGEKTLVLDFDSVRLVSSLGVHAILMAGKQLQNAGGSLILCGFHGQVKRTFEYSGLAALFLTFETLEDWTTAQVAPIPLPARTEAAADGWGWVRNVGSLLEPGVQSEASARWTAAPRVDAILPSRSMRKRSEGGSIVSSIVEAFSQSSACLDFCASLWKSPAVPELTLLKR